MDSGSHGTERSCPYFQQARSLLASSIASVNYTSESEFIHDSTESEFIANVRKVFERLREHNVAVKPRNTKLGLPQVEYVGHLITADGISFTEEKRLKVLDFPKRTNEKQIQMFITNFVTMSQT